MTKTQTATAKRAYVVLSTHDLGRMLAEVARQNSYRHADELNGSECGVFYAALHTDSKGETQICSSDLQNSPQAERA